MELKFLILWCVIASIQSTPLKELDKKPTEVKPMGKMEMDKLKPMIPEEHKTKRESDKPIDLKKDPKEEMPSKIMKREVDEIKVLSDPKKTEDKKVRRATEEKPKEDEHKDMNKMPMMKPKRAAEEKPKLKEEESKEKSKRAAEEKPKLKEEESKDKSKRAAEEKPKLKEEESKEKSKRAAEEKPKLKEEESKDKSKRAAEEKPKEDEHKDMNKMLMMKPMGAAEEKPKEDKDKMPSMMKPKRAAEEKPKLKEEESKEKSKRAAEEKPKEDKDKMPSMMKPKRAAEEKPKLKEEEHKDKPKRAAVDKPKPKEEEHKDKPKRAAEEKPKEEKEKMPVKVRRDAAEELALAEEEKMGEFAAAEDEKMKEAAAAEAEGKDLPMMKNMPTMTEDGHPISPKMAPIMMKPVEDIVPEKTENRPKREEMSPEMHEEGSTEPSRKIPPSIQDEFPKSDMMPPPPATPSKDIVHHEGPDSKFSKITETTPEGRIKETIVIDKTRSESARGFHGGIGKGFHGGKGGGFGGGFGGGKKFF